MDPAGQLLVDLEDLAHEAVLPVGGVRAGVLEPQAVLVDPLVPSLDRGDELLRADDEDDVSGAPDVEASWLPEAEAMRSAPSRVTAWTLPSAKSGWPANAFISWSCVA
jgi:hypothetical protein